MTKFIWADAEKALWIHRPAVSVSPNFQCYHSVLGNLIVVDVGGASTPGYSCGSI